MSVFAIPGVMPTGVPEGGIDGPQAEAMRHQQVISDLRAKEGSLIERAAKARLELRAAVMQWDDVKTDLLRVAGTAGLRDLLVELDKAVPPAEQQMLDKAPAEARPVLQAEPTQSSQPEAGKPKFRR
jgi:hypothetical protein